MGEVWKGRHLSLGANVAVKFELEPSPTGRFVQEGRVAATLSSSRICRVLDEGTHGDRAYLVMEYLEGETLAERLLSEGRLAPEDVVHIFAEVALGLSCAHAAGIVHRDLKPSNLFLQHDGLAKVLDFGVARVVGAEHTASGQFLGTLRYVSPEQVRDAREVTAQSDLWSLGAIAFECIVGRRLFHGDTPPEIVDAICNRPLPRPSDVGPASSEFDVWFERTMQRDPRRRPASVEALVHTLEEALLEPGSSERARPRRVAEVSITRTRSLGPSARPPAARGAWRRPWIGAAAVLTLGYGLGRWLPLAVHGPEDSPRVLAEGELEGTSPATLASHQPTHGSLERGQDFAATSAREASTSPAPTASPPRPSASATSQSIPRTVSQRASSASVPPSKSLPLRPDASTKAAPETGSGDPFGYR
jgi:serine/threonine-protein kinase